MPRSARVLAALALASSAAVVAQGAFDLAGRDALVSGAGGHRPRAGRGRIFETELTCLVSSGSALVSGQMPLVDSGVFSQAFRPAC